MSHCQGFPFQKNHTAGITENAQQLGFYIQGKIPQVFQVTQQP
jgi:hypothetical protein